MLAAAMCSNTVNFYPGSKYMHTIVKDAVSYILKTKTNKGRIIISLLLIIPLRKIKIALMVLKN